MGVQHSLSYSQVQGLATVRFPVIDILDQYYDTITIPTARGLFSYYTIVATIDTLPMPYFPKTR